VWADLFPDDLCVYEMSIGHKNDPKKKKWKWKQKKNGSRKQKKKKLEAVKKLSSSQRSIIVPSSCLQDLIQVAFLKKRGLFGKKMDVSKDSVYLDKKGSFLFDYGTPANFKELIM
jgi:hypothetical protein